MDAIRLRGVSVAFAGVLAAPAFAVSLGMADTFQDGTTEGWASGAANPNPPLNAATGGPAGVGDRYLLLTATGVAGPGGKLVAFSGPQWAGDYPSTGVTGIGMDLNNLGATDLHLRLLFDSAAGSGFSSEVLVPAASGWIHAMFGVSAALANIASFRLYHGPDAVFPGPAIAASLGIDNVTAVPEPSRWQMLFAGLATLVAATNLRRLAAPRSRPAGAPGSTVESSRETRA